MKKLIVSIIKFYKKQKFRKQLIYSGTFDISLFTKINLVDGSKKGDISIGNDTRIYGELMSQNNGKIILGDKVKIGFHGKIGSVNSVEIKSGTAIADYVYIMDNNNHPIHPEDRKAMYASAWNSPLRKWRFSESKPIIIGENVWVGQNVRINKGVTIGNNSIVAANTVVTKDVPSNSIIAGNPGKIVKTDIHKQTQVFTKEMLETINIKLP